MKSIIYSIYGYARWGRQGNRRPLRLEPNRSSLKKGVAWRASARKVARDELGTDETLKRGGGAIEPAKDSLGDARGETLR